MKVAIVIFALWASFALTAQAICSAPSANFYDYTGSNILPRNDDGSTNLITLNTPIQFYGTPRSQLYVNNNGDITFDTPLSTYTPFSLLTTNLPIIAPFFGDVDTRNTASGETEYLETTDATLRERARCEIISMFPALADMAVNDLFIVTWPLVGYYGAHADKLNSFQLVIATGTANGGQPTSVLMYHYGQIQWETGDASGGSGGLGGASARAGFSNGVDQQIEINGAAVNGAYLDSNGATGLIHSTNVGVAGKFAWNISPRVIVDDQCVPYTVDATACIDHAEASSENGNRVSIRFADNGNAQCTGSV